MYRASLKFGWTLTGVPSAAYICYFEKLIGSKSEMFYGERHNLVERWCQAIESQGNILIDNNIMNFYE